MDNKLKILLISTIILIAGGITIGIINNNKNSSSLGTPVLAASETQFDLGDVSMADGLAKRTINLTNNGTADLKINSIKTSCVCTVATLEVEGKSKSPEFGMHTNTSFWSESIKPGQSAKLEIIYDPNAHGPDATGPITRTVTLLSNNQGKKQARTNITFRANVTK